MAVIESGATIKEFYDSEHYPYDPIWYEVYVSGESIFWDEVLDKCIGFCKDHGYDYKIERLERGEIRKMKNKNRSGEVIPLFLLIIFAILWVWFVAVGVEQRELKREEMQEKEWARREEKIRMEYRIKYLEEKLGIKTNDLCVPEQKIGEDASFYQDCTVVE